MDAGSVLVAPLLNLHLSACLFLLRSSVAIHGQHCVTEQYLSGMVSTAVIAKSLNFKRLGSEYVYNVHNRDAQVAAACGEHCGRALSLKRTEHAHSLMLNVHKLAQASTISAATQVQSKTNAGAKANLKCFRPVVSRTQACIGRPHILSLAQPLRRGSQNQ